MARNPAPSYYARVHKADTLFAIVEQLRSEGVDAHHALADTDLTPTQLASHDCRVSYRQLEAVIGNALRLSTDLAIALNAGSRVCVTSYGMYGYAMLSSRTLAEVVDLTNKYIRIGTPCCMAVMTKSETSVLCCLSPMHWYDETTEIYRFAVEFALAAHQKVIRDLLGPQFVFKRIMLRYGRPKHSTLYTGLFGAQVDYGQAENGYEFDAAHLHAPLPFADPRSNAMVSEICETMLLEIEQVSDMAGAVRRILIENLGHMRRLGDVAKTLNIHPRSLRRALAAEGTSYSEVFSSIRAELAIRYLRETDMTSEDIAYRLGFSDAANFRHSFKRLIGVPPSEYRRNAKHNAVSSV
ncbi:AraC family transcriptional regulator [Roseibium aquae]|uniref:AraC family transcriptional regulator n=1 Tax=Roseibium aquae TaxID=1323746 RepID=A0A916TLK6_9HYPH|nr:AraC family transcriptional regulator [Roseibium aquae]GGB57003.1 AraC family transcriptional regulator [Roseibium aquae]